MVKKKYNLFNIRQNDYLVSMIKDEAVKICKLGSGNTCCAYLVCGADGFECIKRTHLRDNIDARLKAGTMNAQGTGGWKDCAWEEENV